MCLFFIMTLRVMMMSPWRMMCVIVIKSHLVGRRYRFHSRIERQFLPNMAMRLSG